MSLEEIFETGTDEDKIRSMESIRNDRIMDAYPLLEKEVDDPRLKHSTLITMAFLDLERTVPYLNREMDNVPDSYTWKGNPNYENCHFVLTMEVILEDQYDLGRLSEAIDLFKPMDQRRKDFFQYTIQCLCYNKEENILVDL